MAIEKGRVSEAGKKRGHHFLATLLASKLFNQLLESRMYGTVLYSHVAKVLASFDRVTEQECL